MTLYTATRRSPPPSVPGYAFRSAEEAWFWFISAWQARRDGARLVADAGRMPRRCEPIDILRILDRLIRQRRLGREHVLILRHYGLRFLPPDPDRPRERRAATLWAAAMKALGEALMAKGIVDGPAALFGSPQRDTRVHHVTGR